MSIFILKGILTVKEEYVESIKQRLEECEDVALLDLILQLLQKSNETNNENTK